MTDTISPEFLEFMKAAEKFLRFMKCEEGKWYHVKFQAKLTEDSVECDQVIAYYDPQEMK